MWRLFRWLVTLAVLGVLGAVIFFPAAAWWKERSRPRYLTAKVSRGRVESVVNSTGTIKPVRSVQVGAFVSGPIEEVFVNFNDRVTKGQEARIDQRLLKAAVDRDEAALETQKADADRVGALLQQAKNNEARAKKLQKINRDYLSDTEMDQFVFNRKSLEAQKKLAEAMIAQAKALLKNSRTNLEYTSITSPEAGIVIERKVDRGQTVAASFQTPELFVIAPELDKHVHVYASVDEADVGQIREAQVQSREVQFTVDAHPRDLFTGHIYQVRQSSTTTQNVVTYPVVIDAPNPDLKLMPGMTANISFEIESRDDVLRVPAAALRFVPAAVKVRPEDRYRLDTPQRSSQESGIKQSARQKAESAKGRSKRVVWVRGENDLLRAVDVTLGLIDNQYAELIAGDLKEDDEVITALDTTAR